MKLKVTKAGLALRAAVQQEVKEGRTQNDIARLVACDSGNFAKILAFERLPGRALSGRIAEKLDIPAAGWDEAVAEEKPSNGGEAA